MAVVTSREARRVMRAGRGLVEHADSNHPVVASRPFYKEIPDRAWEGQRCFLIGGGPSLQNFDWTRLEGELTIGVNRTPEAFYPTINFSMDTRFARWVREKKYGEEFDTRWRGYKGYKVWLETGPNIPSDAFTLVSAGGDKFTESMREGLGGGCNSGYGALNLAYCLGADPIYLLGYDMKGLGSGAQAWWNSTPHPMVQPESRYKQLFVPNFERIAPMLEERRRVVNLNPDSALTCFSFGDVADIPKQDKPIVVSYYTVGTGYEEEAKRLLKSVGKFSLDYYIQGIPSRGSWISNVQHKPTFLREMIERFPDRTLLMVDADAEFLKYPTLLCDFHQADIGIHYRQRDGTRRELLSGTIFMRPCPVVNNVLKAWEDECKANPSEWDQRALSRVLKRVRYSSARIIDLPAQYCTIFDSMSDVRDPVILHHQASRYLKKGIE